MTIDSILSQIDDEIARLTQARKLLASAGVGTAPKPRAAKKSAGTKRRKRVLSPEARKRIADAQHRRWAAQKAKSK